MNKVLNLISLAKKAGKVKTGEYLSMKSLKEGMAYLLIIASDTSERSKERIMKMCEIFSCECVVFGSKEELGHFTGSKDKSVICINDEGFSKALLKIIQNSEDK